MIIMENKILDIIIPVYNKQDFLEELTKSLSVLCQKTVNVIFVDDGSIDRSLEILMLNSRDNFYIYSKKNGGVSSARNYGLLQSRSKYVWFFDPDDQITSDTFSIIESLKNYDHDILVFNYYRFNVKNKNIESFIFDDYGLTNTFNFSEKYSYFSNKNNMSFIWNKFYKKTYIDSCIFDEVLSLSEDRKFNLELFNKEGSVYIIDKFLYKYNIYEEGTLSTNKDIKKIKDVYSTNLLNIEYLGGGRRYVKMHILEQIISRAKLNYKNLFNFYIKEHRKFEISILPFYSIKDIMVFIMVSLHMLRLFLKAYSLFKKL